ncbi:MAG: hypothetical protein WC610_02785 [Patescibacteria group bacterium]
MSHQMTPEAEHINIGFEGEIIKKLFGNDEQKIQQWIEENNFENSAIIREAINSDEVYDLLNSGSEEDYERAIDLAILKFNNLKEERHQISEAA